MHKKVLTEVDLYTGEIQMPKGFDIDRDKIRNDIIESFVKKNRINTNPQAYAFDDYVVPFSQPLQWTQIVTGKQAQHNHQKHKLVD